jgi:hypothetical protein
MASLYNLAQQIQSKTGGKGTWQELISDVKKTYAFVVKQIWYENKGQGVGEVDGAFIIPFLNQQPIINTTTNTYYIDLLSSYVTLPQEGGVVSVSYMGSPNTNFVLTNAGSVGRLSNITAGVMGGRQLYYIEGMKMYFPRMNRATSLPLITRFAVALDNVDVDESLNIPPDVQEQIVNLCIQKYLPQAEMINQNIK